MQQLPDAKWEILLAFELNPLFVIIGVSMLLAWFPAFQMCIYFNYKAWLFLHTFEDVNFGL